MYALDNNIEIFRILFLDVGKGQYETFKHLVVSGNKKLAGWCWRKMPIANVNYDDDIEILEMIVRFVLDHTSDSRRHTTKMFLTRCMAIHPEKNALRLMKIIAPSDELLMGCRIPQERKDKYLELCSNERN